MSTLALVLALTALAVPLLHRDLKRADRRRRMRLAMAPMRRAFKAFSATVGAALLPAMSEAVRAAADLDAAMRQVTVTITADTSGYIAALRKAARETP